MNKKYKVIIYLSLFTILYSYSKYLFATADDSLRIINHFENARLQPEKEEQYIKESEDILKTNPHLKNLYDYSLAKHYILKGDFTLAKSLVEEKINNYSNQEKDIYLAKYYNLLASILAYQNKPEEVIKNYKKAIEIFELNNENDNAAMVYFNLSNIFLGRLDFNSARQNIKKAKELLDPHKNIEYNSLVNSILSITSLKTNEEIENATNLAKIALRLADSSKSIQAIVLANYAMGESMNFEHKYKEAIKYLKKSVELSGKYNLSNIALSSSAALMHSYLNSENYERVIDIGKNSLEKAKQFENNEIQFNLFKNIAQAHAALGHYEEAYSNLKVALEEYMHKVNEENQKNIQNYLIEYETEKKENVILLQEKKLKTQQIWIIILLSFLILSFVILIFYRELNKIKNLKLKEEKEKAVLESLAIGERKERKRLAKELHDGIASQLTAIKLLLENNDFNPEKEKQILNIIKETHREVRNISHSIMPIDFNKIQLHDALKKFCYQIHSKELNIYFFSNIENVPIDTPIAHSLYRATQEIIQNAIKHAKAKTLHVQILIKNQILEISVEDDGIGINTENHKTPGNTLHFLHERLNLIDASIEIETHNNKGSVFTITKTLER